MKNSLPKIYQNTALVAFIYSIMLIIYAIYNQFFYIDGTWFHGFTANGFSVFSSLIWIGILFIFKLFLNKVLNYSKANSLINAYLIFLSITTFSIAKVVYQSIKVYSSLEKGDTFSSLTTFATSSISGAILIFISNFAIILICILLGNRIRKIDIIQAKLFQILGYSFISYGIISLLETFSLFGTDIFQFLIKAGLSVTIGLILKKIYEMNLSDLNVLTNFEKPNEIAQTKSETERPISFNKEEVKKTYSEIEELPNVNLDELEDKELVLSYFENLTKVELNRIENIVESKYNRSLTDEQKHNLVIHYITENKIYDHQRFLPNN